MSTVSSALNVVAEPLLGGHEVKHACNVTKDRVVAVLTRLGWGGTWTLKQGEQVNGASPFRWKIVESMSDPRHAFALHVIHKSGDNSTRYNYWLYWPELYNAAQVKAAFAQVDNQGLLPKPPTTAKDMTIIKKDELPLDVRVTSEPRLITPAVTPVTSPLFAGPGQCSKQDYLDKLREAVDILGLPFMPIHVGLDLFVGAYMISPAIASSCIVFNDENRKQRKAAQRKYGVDMSQDLWHIHHQGMAFSLYPDLRLLDGQNRLEKIISTGKTIPMMITFNVPLAAVVAIDHMEKRTLIDSVHMVNVKTAGLHAMVEMAMQGFSVPKGTAKPSDEVAILFMNKYAESFDWCVQHLGEKPKVPCIDVIPVQAAIFRAFYTEDKDRLAAFVHALRRGVVVNEAEDGQAIDLATKLRKSAAAEKKALKRQAVYAYTTKAISLFCQRKRVQCFKPDTSERYQLPSAPELRT